MSLLYTLLLTSLRVATWVAWRRAAKSEEKYAVLVAKSEALHAAGKRPAKEMDDFARAAAYHQLGAVVAQRDAQEIRASKKADRAQRIEAAKDAVREWKGRKLPYYAGVVDAWAVSILTQVFQPHVAELIVSHVREWVEMGMAMV